MSQTDDLEADLDLGLTDGDDQEDTTEGLQRSLAAEIALSPVVQTVALMFVGYIGGWWWGVTPLSPFTAAPPLEYRPFTVVTAIYGHASLSHFLGNALLVSIFGYLVARRSSLIRFHLFFIATGAASIAVHIAIHTARPAGQAPFVLGASGAALALLGYVISANVVSETLTSWLALSRAVGLVLVAVVTGWLTLRYSGPGVANIAHATGAALGLIAGRFHLLRAR